MPKLDGLPPAIAALLPRRCYTGGLGLGLDSMSWPKGCPHGVAKESHVGAKSGSCLALTAGGAGVCLDVLMQCTWVGCMSCQMNLGACEGGA